MPNPCACGEKVEPVKELEGWTMEHCGVKVVRMLFNDCIKEWNSKQEKSHEQVQSL